MNLDKLKQKLIPIIEPLGLSVYSIRTKIEFGEKIVEILLDTDTIDINDLEKIHLAYMDRLDDHDLDDDYYLELSSLGLERPIRTPEELIETIGRYLYIESNTYKGYGTLIAYQDGMLTLEINQRGRIKKVNVAYDQIQFIRTAVKV